ncbi:DNA mismatch repair protein MutS2 [Lachnospiraceae bacterium XBB1006]|nr:DNA mismatch repair protein MutS2 [Lachnospiraceae bacterium XBB1006]
MNKKVLKTLEFDKIINQLVEFAATESGKDHCRRLTPSYDLPHIREMQQETSAALSRILRHGALSFSGVHDLRSAMKRLEIGGVLNIIELLHICSLLDTTKRAVNYQRNEKAEEEGDCLTALFDALMPLTDLNTEIRRCILSEDEIADDASTRLFSIRKSIRRTNEKVRQQLNSLMTQSSTQTILQDNVITMRNGRYCLPVRADAKGQMPGMVHDQSSSGSTYFIEPMAVVKLNNELTELELKEQEEIEVILSTLSNAVAEHVEVLRENIRILIRLDFIFARGMLARQQNAMMPEFTLDGTIRIRKGRHPLLPQDKVVPLDIHLGDDFDLLVVTGPNTGGKTVALKTVGLLTLMGQSGLHIPAGDRSTLSLFQEVYADIGDEQSIEQNLSTFSSHMTNIVSIGEKANDHSLVLFDELCAGTDPTEGAALAISILWDLMNRGAKIMATTHYAELKIFALSTPRVENACCEFDVATLSPTYRLLIGVPGKSNAFAISGKLGLPTYIIDDAKKRLDKDTETFEDVLTDLEQKRVALEESRNAALKHEKEVADLKKQLEAKQEDIQEKRRRLLEDASQEANQILAQAKEIADSTIMAFNRYQEASPNLQDMEAKRSRVREQIKKNAENLKVSSPEKPVSAKPLTLHIGDMVKVHSLNLTGTVHTLPDAKGNLFVQMGILRSQVNVSDLSLVDETPSQAKKKGKSGGVRTSGLQKSSSIRSEINLIGMTVDEALYSLDKYLDDAYLAHLESVRIVHGKGTGALRNAVCNHLKKSKIIKSYRAGVFGEGDAGVTIAEFK